MLLLIADAAAAVAPSVLDVTTIAPAISAIGSTGLAVWLAVYTQTTTLPNQAAAHRDERKEINEANSKTIDRILDEMKQQRELFDKLRSAQH